MTLRFIKDSLLPQHILVDKGDIFDIIEIITTTFKNKIYVIDCYDYIKKRTIDDLCKYISSNYNLISELVYNNEIEIIE